MTRQELCQILGLPVDTPAAALVQARAGRCAEIELALRGEDLPKPVKLKLRQESALLATALDLIAELEVIGRIEAFLAEIAAEFAKPGPVLGVIRLCLGKLKPLVPEVKDEGTRFGFEKKLIEIEERVGRLAEPAETPAVSEGTRERIEGYFAEMAAELAKPAPGRGVVRLCLNKLKPLVEGINDETMRYGWEKRIAQIEDRMGLRVSTAPFPPAKELTPPVVETADRGGAPPVIEPKPAPPRSPKPARATRPKAGPAGGTLLQLRPVASERPGPRLGPPIHFVARPRFVLGRRRASVDFVTAFLPENQDNHQKNERISRINTTLFVRDNQIWVQDGELMTDGEAKPSANGTLIDGRPITAAEAFSFTKERRLKVGLHNYELAVLQLPATAPQGPMLAAAAGTLSTLPVRLVAGGPAGCIRFMPTTGREVTVMAVWLFTDAAVGTDPQSAVRLEQGRLPAVAARVHHWQGGFWLEAPAVGESVVMLDDSRLAAGEVVPLQAAHGVCLGDLRYELLVS